MPSHVTFQVAEAGCSSCSARVRNALEPVGAVEEIVIDEQADAATVRVAGPIREDTVAAALAEASMGTGHRYRVKPGSWRVDG